MKEKGFDSVEALKKLYIQLKRTQNKLKELETLRHEPIAIIGMGCRYPGNVNNPEAFWQLLSEGRDAVIEVPPKRWQIHETCHTDSQMPGKMITTTAGYLTCPVDTFDASFFNISPKEARALDPQQRLLLEVTWEAFENSAIGVNRLKGSNTGVFIGMCGDDYTQAHLHSGDPEHIDAYSLTGTTFSTAAGRVSYFFGFEGPSMVIDTACSSSFTAIHYAVCSLRWGETDIAVVGGVNLILTPNNHICLSRMQALSPQGKCRTFDAKADGYVRGEGCGVVILKRLSRAKEDNNRIHAVIRGTAINQDGKSSGLTAPSAKAQEKVITKALEDAGITPDQVDYIETHGTGTSLGDPIEVEALGNVYSQGRSTGHPLLIGAVKTNIGHLEAAAGMAGLLKTILAMEHQSIPPTLHFETPNPYIPWDTLPVRVVSRLTPWEAKQKKRTAGISAFGFSGTNIHVILEEAPPSETIHPDYTPPPFLLPLSAKTPEALLHSVENYIPFLTTTPNNLADICYTAQKGRSHFNWRQAVVGADSDQFTEKLKALLYEKPGNIEPIKKKEKQKIAYLFTGQGSQYINMGRQLFETNPVFLSAVEACDRLFTPLLQTSLITLLYPEPGSQSDESSIDKTIYTQPLIFTLQYAILNLWKSLGVTPQAVVGHSIGEYAAAVAAGVMTLEQAVQLVALRGKLMQEVPGNGTMGVIMADEPTVTRLIEPFKEKLAIAAINTRENISISGEAEAVAQVLALARQQGLKTRPLTVSHAFHSPMMDSITEKFAATAQNINFSVPNPEIDFISTLEGKAIGNQLTFADYWKRQIRNPVRYYEAIKVLEASGYEIFLEIGPAPILSSLGAQIITNPHSLFIPSMRRGQPDRETFLTALGELYKAGIDPEWQGLEQPGRHRTVTLPTYPFQRQSYWMELPNIISPNHNQHSTSNEIDRYIYTLQWQESPLQTNIHRSNSSTGIDQWLIFTDENHTGLVLGEVLEREGYSCIYVLKGSEYYKNGAVVCMINPVSLEDFSRLFKEIFIPRESIGSKLGILYLWGIDTLLNCENENSIMGNKISETQKISCGSILNILTVVEDLQLASKVKLWILTKNSQQFYEDSINAPVSTGIDSKETTTNQKFCGGSGGGFSKEPPDRRRQKAIPPWQSPLWGFGRTIALENPALWGGLIDIHHPLEKTTIFRIVKELLHGHEDQVCYGINGRRHVPRIQHGLGTMQRSDNRRPFPNQEGTYLITGGTGGLGLEIAGWLAAKGGRHLVLVARNTPQSSAQKIINNLKAEGMDIDFITCDVSKGDQVNRLFEQISQKMKPLCGIFHTAGVLDDSTLAGQSWERFQKVFASKVYGAWNLHRASLQLDLELFVLFSSAVSWLGNAGQANYAAANEYLNALAQYRRRLNFPALSINWGPWKHIGMAVVQKNRGERMAARGMKSFEPWVGLELLETLIRKNPAQACCLDIDWQQFSPYAPYKQKKGILSALLPQENGEKNRESTPETDTIIAELTQAAPNQRHRLLLSILAETTAHVMGYRDTRKVAVDKPLVEQGADSLMLMEIRNRLQRVLEFSFSVTILYSHPTLEKIAAYLQEEMFPGEEDTRRQSPEKAPTASKQLLEEIDALLQ